MPAAFLALRFIADDDGTGKLVARVSVRGFAGEGGAYFGVDDIERFAAALGEFPIGTDPRPSLAGGFWKKDMSGELDQEHLALVAYPVDSRGHIGVQVRIADEVWAHRPEECRRLQVEVLTSYESLQKFGNQLLALVRENVEEAVLEDEGLP